MIYIIARTINDKMVEIVIGDKFAIQFRGMK